jgi:formiminoglutamase
MNHFKFYNKQDILSLTRIRRFETKLGELIDHVTDNARWQHEIESSAADYVIFGIPEDMGVLANHGVGGAHTSWVPFLESFLNIQSNDFLEGNEMMLLGHFDFSDIKELVIKNSPNEEERVSAYRHALHLVDEAVSELVKHITALGKIPIAIGGGHNNAYGMIRGAAKGLHKSGKTPMPQINCINLDAHTDFRPTEGRHSGNAFRYAIEDGFLNKYCVIGIHENYIPQNVWIDMVNNPFMDCITYEDVFIHEKYNFIQAVAHATGFTEETFTGIELDMDSIENTLSSAFTPCGVQPLHARQYLSFAARDSNVAYVHICEGAAQTENGQQQASVGKLIGYLVSDFIKAHCEMLEG